MSKYLSSVSRIALAAAALSSIASLAEAADTTIHSGEIVTTTQGASSPDTLTVEQGGTIDVVDDGSAVELGNGGSGGTVTLDNYGTINATGDSAQHTILGGQGQSDNPLNIIINNYETGLISSGNNSNRDVIRPSANNNNVTVNNWGTIVHNGIDEGSTSQGDAIDFQDKGLSRAVNNYETGLIEGNRHGITGDVPVTVYNEGQIAGRNGSGINIDGGGVVVTNYGIITGNYRGEGEGDGDAIDTDGDLTLDNYGRIEGLGAGGFNDGEQNFAEGLAIGGGTINNFLGGEIYGKGNGILADDSGGGATEIVTKIYNEGLIEAADFDGIRLVGVNNDEIVNKGTIRAGEHGVAIDMGAGQDTLTLFTGSTVEGLIDGGLGQNTLNLEGTGSDTLGDDLINFHTMNLNAGRWTLEGRHDYEFVNIVQGATLVVEEGVAELGIDPNGTLNIDGGRVEASGTLGQTSMAGGTLAVAGDRIGTLTIEDYFSIQDLPVRNDLNQVIGYQGSTLEFTVDAAGHSDFLKITNANSDMTLGLYQGINTIDGFAYGPNLKIEALAGNYAEETTYHIIHVDGTIDVAGEGFRDVTTNFAFLDASVQIDPSDVYLTLVRNDTAFWDVAETKNESAVAHAIAAAGGSNLHNEIVTMSVEEAKAAYNGLSGEIYASTMSAQIVQANLVTDTLQSRLGAGLGGSTGGSATPAFAAPQYLGASEKERAHDGDGVRHAGWLKGYGEWLSLDDDGNAGALEGTVGGVLGGLDFVSKNGLLGLAGGYSVASTDIASRQANEDTDTFLVAAYGAYLLDHVKLSGGASYGWSSSDSERVALGDQLTASYDGNTTNVFGEIAYRARMGATVFEPFAGVSHVSVDEDSFTEEGGIAVLTSDGQTFDSTASTVGLRAVYDIVTTGETRVTPYGSLAWRHAYGDVTPDAVLSFVDTGTSFTVDGAPIAQDSLIVGAGIEFGLAQGVALGFDYTGAFADEATSNAGKATGRIEF